MYVRCRLLGDDISMPGADVDSLLACWCGEHIPGLSGAWGIPAVVVPSLRNRLFSTFNKTPIKTRLALLSWLPPLSGTSPVNL